MVQLLAFRRPELVTALVLVDPAHEDAAAILPGLARWLLRQAPKLKALTGRPDELAGAAASRPLLRQLLAAARPFPDVPVIVISATRGFPRSMRAHWTEPARRAWRAPWRKDATSRPTAAATPFISSSRNWSPRPSSRQLPPQNTQAQDLTEPAGCRLEHQKPRPRPRRRHHHPLSRIRTVIVRQAVTWKELTKGCTRRPVRRSQACHGGRVPSPWRVRDRGVSCPTTTAAIE